MNVLDQLITVIPKLIVPTLTDLFCVHVAVDTLEMGLFAKVSGRFIIIYYIYLCFDFIDPIRYFLLVLDFQ
jgi:hypothetical protein